MKKLYIVLVLIFFTFLPLLSQNPPVKKPSLKEELSNPFCFFLVPSDELGFKNSPKGTQLTYDGAFFTGHGELDLLIGSDYKPINQRIRTLYKGYIPVYTYYQNRDGVKYRVRAFAAPLNLEPTNALINFIEIRAENITDKPQNAGVGFSFVSGKDKFRRCKRINYRNWYDKKFMDFKIYNSKNPEYNFYFEKAFKNRHFIFSYSYNGDVKDFTVKGKIKNRLRTEFNFVLRPKEKETFIIKMPYVPVFEEKKEIINKIISADYYDYLNKVIEFWEKEHSKGMQIEIPEKKVNDTIKAGFTYLLMARDTLKDGRIEQHVNQFQYDKFYPRDGAYMARVYDMYNRKELAKETVDNFIRYDQKGNPISFVSIYPDDWGQILWAIGAYYRTFNDINFIKKIYKLIPTHFDKFINLCKKDPLGIWPSAGPYDNEAINGHYTGHSFWALLGMKEAINIAKTLNKTEDERFYKKIYEKYEDVFKKIFSNILKKTEGYVPPGLDVPEDGYDWANASAGVYPFEIFSPFENFVNSTVSLIRKYKYREGIMTYGPNAYAVYLAKKRGKDLKPGWLHHYETFYVTETLLAMGKQREVIEDLYSILAHTGSTNDGFEFSVKPWDNRDTGHNLPPHGWFAARYNELIRNMLLREFGNELHLFSAISPEWIKPGKTIKLSNGITYFGKISMEYRVKKDGAEIDLKTQFRKKPEKIYLHIPYFVKISKAIVDNKIIKIKKLKYDSAIIIPSSAKKIIFKWKIILTKQLNFKNAARSLLKKYHSREKNFDKRYLF